MKLYKDRTWCGRCGNKGWCRIDRAGFPTCKDCGVLQRLVRRCWINDVDPVSASPIQLLCVPGVGRKSLRLLLDWQDHLRMRDVRSARAADLIRKIK